MDTKILKEGWLKKDRTWRWFILREGVHQPSLRWYKAPRQKERGVVDDLVSWTLYVSTDARPLSIKIEPPDSRRPTLYLSSDNVLDVVEWVKELRRVRNLHAQKVASLRALAQQPSQDASSLPFVPAIPIEPPSPSSSPSPSSAFVAVADDYEISLPAPSIQRVPSLSLSSGISSVASSSSSSPASTPDPSPRSPEKPPTAPTTPQQTRSFIDMFSVLPHTVVTRILSFLEDQDAYNLSLACSPSYSSSTESLAQATTSPVSVPSSSSPSSSRFRITPSVGARAARALTASFFRSHSSTISVSAASSASTSTSFALPSYKFEGVNTEEDDGLMDDVDYMSKSATIRRKGQQVFQELLSKAKARARRVNVGSPSTNASAPIATSPPSSPPGSPPSSPRTRERRSRTLSPPKLTAGFVKDNVAATMQKVFKTPEERWLKVIARGHAYTKQNPHKLQRMIGQGDGIPAALRGRVWMVFTNAEEKKKQEPGLYQMLISSPIPQDSLDQIKLDIERTFPDQPFFMQKEGLDTLYRVLHANTAHNASMGYVQGVNFLAGTLLLVLPEEDAFYVLVQLMHSYLFQHMFRHNFPALKKSFWIFEQLFKHHLPQAYQHFNSCDIVPTMYATEWFLTLFSSTLSLPVVLRIWDLFLLKGWVAAHKAAIALLKLSKDRLLDPFDRLLVFLKNVGSVHTDAGLVITTTLATRIPQATYAKTRRNYELYFNTYLPENADEEVQPSMVSDDEEDKEEEREERGRLQI